MSTPAPKVEFWYEFASTYSYLSAMRIEDAARPAGVNVVWKPFLLGPIFFAQGWNTSPFNLYKAKGDYMVRDIERIGKERGLAFHLPDPFPQNSLLGARVATALADQGQRAAFVKAVYVAEFAERRRIDDPAVLGECLGKVGADATATLQATQSDAVKLALRNETAEAQRLGVFGAPAFTTANGELFWGDDRLDMAIRWAAT